MTPLAITVAPEVRAALRASAEELVLVKRDAVDHAGATPGAGDAVARHRAELAAVAELATALAATEVDAPVSGDRALLAELAHAALVALLEDELGRLLEGSSPTAAAVERMAMALRTGQGLGRVLALALASA